MRLRVKVLQPPSCRKDEEVAAFPSSGANVSKTARVIRPQTRQRRPTRLPP
jgi:hypothetical protein